MSTVLKSSYLLDSEIGSITLSDFIPAAHLTLPEGATHVRFCNAFIRLDFENGLYERQQSDEVSLPIDFQKNTVILTPSDIPSLPGISLYLLQITFYQEVNGVSYVLNNGAHNILNLIEVL